MPFIVNLGMIAEPQIGLISRQNHTESHLPMTSPRTAIGIVENGLLASARIIFARTALVSGLALGLAACGGGGSSSAPPTGGGGGGGGTGACSIANQIAFADDVLNDWYLFPNLLDNTVNPSNFSTVQSFLDARVAPARASGRDEGFTFATSIAEENALIASGSSAGIGIRLSYDVNQNRVFILEAFEGAPGFIAGMDRGTELLAIGTNASNAQSVSSLMASGGPAAVSDALGPTEGGVTRFIRFETADGNVIAQNITKAEFSLDPISDRYGVQILNDGGKQVGYINLRTFIVEDAARQLREAYGQFAAAGVTELIIDFRYNGGGLVDVADTMGDLMGQGRQGDVWSRTLFNALRSNRNSTDLFDFENNSIRPTKIAFIGTGSTASASELVINSMLPYLADANVALVGEDTLGKPYGQFGFDLADCDLRIRALTFETVNADNEGDYFNGIAELMPNTCRAGDDPAFALGDPQEASTMAALDFLGGRSCTPFSSSDPLAPQASRSRQMLRPANPTAAQFEIPGLY